MTSYNYDITASNVWDALQRLAEVAPGIRVSDLLDQDQDRVDKYSLDFQGLSLDYSKNLVTDEVMQLLLELVAESPLDAQREKLFTGQEINITEQRPVLHAALRASPTQLQQDGLSEASVQIAGQKRRIKAVSDQIRSGAWLGSTGKRVTDIVNLGIGGSDLGPKLACEALKEFSHGRINCHFVSNVDGELIQSTLKNLEPETTLVILSSKTITTQETLLNAQTAANWFEHSLGLANAYASPHFIGVTASPENAVKLGISDENILEFGDWVGGRYSLWSTIGLSIAICIGYDNFDRIFAGARQMDVHFRESPARENMPSNVLLMEKLTPETFGALIALYEHKVFVQGCLWNVNSFDQWGVELGKALANDLLQGNAELDSSTRNLMDKLNASL